VIRYDLRIIFFEVMSLVVLVIEFYCIVFFP
jgi:hypothetical protein